MLFSGKPVAHDFLMKEQQELMWVADQNYGYLRSAVPMLDDFGFYRDDKIGD